MSDYNSSLPIRTENDGDAVVKIADATVPSQQLKVLVDGSINVNDNGGSITVDATDLDIRDLVFATDKVDVSGSTVELGATTLAALESITVVATDLDIRDLSHTLDSIKIGDGTDFLAINSDGSINVIQQEDTGTEVVDFNTAPTLAAAATSNHDLVFATASKLYQVLASASGKLKIEVQVETGAATGTFVTKAVAFNSTATPNIDISLSKYAAIPLGAKVRIIRTNKDNQAQDVYSTIVGILA